MTDIGKRIDALMVGPKLVNIHVIYDEANDTWLGKMAPTPWLLRFGTREDRNILDIAAEGTTPSEVLRKLAEMLE